MTDAKGIWILQISSISSGFRGTLNSWSISFDKPTPDDGLGEPITDRFSTDFRIFTEDPTNSLSHSASAPVGASPIADNADTTIPDAYTGRISAIAIDPSDPSGNTVYVGGASGGLWKTTNFLTSDKMGPTWLPLTDFGNTLSLNIGSITIQPRNNDPGQSIIFAATGEGAQGSPGVGVIRSMDGGATWTLLDSTTNTDATGNPLLMGDANRDHEFLGATAYKIVVDPHPTPAGEVIVYMALSDTATSLAHTNNVGVGGIWQSLDTGKHWTLMMAGQATDVTLDLASGHVDAVNNPTGNLDIVYAAFRGVNGTNGAAGVYQSPNRGVVWNALAGGVGNPQIRDINPPLNPAFPVDAPAVVPGAASGRILLAKPAPTGDAFKDVQYQGWLYAMVVTPPGQTPITITPLGMLEGVNLAPTPMAALYMTKDFGQNWTRVRIADSGYNPLLNDATVPTNDYTNLDFPVLDDGENSASIAVDPTDPNVIYIGGTIRAGYNQTQMIRVNTTGITDAHAFFIADDLADGGATNGATGSISMSSGAGGGSKYYSPGGTPYLNFQRDPGAPFESDSTVYVQGVVTGLAPSHWTNLGARAKWTPFDALETGNNNQMIVTMVDPVTGHARLIVGSGTGIYTGVDSTSDTGLATYSTNLGTAQLPFGFRGGNLEIEQYVYGAAQPSSMAADAAGAMFYGAADGFGATGSAGGILSNGQEIWQPDSRTADERGLTLTQNNGVGFSRVGNIATDQTGSGAFYQYIWSSTTGTMTDFFRVSGSGRTSGLLQAGDNPDLVIGQWTDNPVTFAVNPVNKDQAVIGSDTGRIFATTNQGVFWLQIAAPATMGNSQVNAFAFGAPQINDPVGGINNVIYAGTKAGQIYVTYVGGSGNAWINLSNGLDGLPIAAIITNPLRGTYEAYAVTQGNPDANPPILSHVYHLANSTVANPQWVNITGNLNNFSYWGFGDFAMQEDGPSLGTTALPHVASLTSVVADWRYVIPDNPAAPNGPHHPALYVGGEGGVWRSLDQGKTWQLFPDIGVDGACRMAASCPTSG